MSTSHAISDTICETRKVRERLNFSKPTTNRGGGFHLQHANNMGRADHIQSKIERIYKINIS